MLGALPAAGQQSAQGVVLPDNFKLNMLIRGTVIALNHANKTGNYTVLRDLGAPGFQQANDAARLGQIFAPLRARKVDLDPIFFFQPTLVKQPAFENGMLRLTGFFPTKPEQINFDIILQPSGGNWLLFGLAVNTSQAQAAVAAATPPLKPVGATPKAVKPPAPDKKAEASAAAPAAAAGNPKSAVDASASKTVVKPGSSTNSVQIDLSKKLLQPGANP